MKLALLELLRFILLITNLPIRGWPSEIYREAIFLPVILNEAVKYSSSHVADTAGLWSIRGGAKIFHVMNLPIRD